MPFTFGYAIAGGSTGGGGAGVAVEGSLYILSEGASVTKISLYSDNTINGTDNVKCMIYSDNAGYPNALLGTTNVTSINSATPQWWDFTFAAPINLTAGSYWLVFVAQVGIQYYFDTGSTNQHYEKQGTYYSSPPDPFPAAATGGARKQSIYATFNETSPLTFVRRAII